jgi:hypothetical protein
MSYFIICFLFVCGLGDAYTLKLSLTSRRQVIKRKPLSFMDFMNEQRKSTPIMVESREFSPVPDIIPPTSPIFTPSSASALARPPSPQFSKPNQRGTENPPNNLSQQHRRSFQTSSSGGGGEGEGGVTTRQEGEEGVARRRSRIPTVPSRPSTLPR